MKNLTNELKITENQEIKVISIGLNNQCKQCITKSILFKKNDKWLLKNGGITVIIHDLTDLYLDTPENRKELKNLLTK